MNTELVELIVDIVVKYVIPACGVAITAFIIPWLKKKIGDQKFNTALKWAEVLVKASEQMFGSGEGESKKQYVTEQLSAKFKWLTEAQIEQILESCTYEVSKAIDSTKGGTYDVSDYVTPTNTEESTTETTTKTETKTTEETKSNKIVID
jgi:hypothetical protein